MASSDKNNSTTEHWTDYLPICSDSGVGFSPNQRYRADGGRREEHEFEDQSFHFHLEDKACYLYGVFDGYNGKAAAEFSAQKLPAELLLGQLMDNMSDDEVKEVLKQAIIEVEKGFFDSIGDKLVEKTLIQEEIADMNEYDAIQQFPLKVNRLRAIEQEIACGSTAVVALIYNDKLFVTNVGNSRAVLSSYDSNGHLNIRQLSTDHVISNEDELMRLSNLGLDIESIRHGLKLGNHDSTRCIGDYTVKGGYQEFDILSGASAEPVIGEPDSFGGLVIDESFYFLVLMSDGIYKSLENSTVLQHDANVEIVRLIDNEIQAQATINGVCQAVVDKICRYHHDGFMNQNKLCESRDDMTLLLRLFNARLGGRTPSPLSKLDGIHPLSDVNSPPFVRFPVPSGGFTLPPTFNSPQGAQPRLIRDPPFRGQDAATVSNASEPSHVASPAVQQQPGQTDSEFIESYVDFTEYYRALEMHGEDFVLNTVQL
ncbi:TGF-beta-activated kinase 1 and MAP3K7-binding protein 1-like [Xenia sp. Carnegie-2017]|uniref:TGF-beta-activated kinase 1 and MAP3K7-binding protein 1-like n=1 Tax=Xenia sp. Carnegie-2017 TaxID=2897299 RepID=UPI001F04942F|nr:TGF-beta-activated kinase 1 and MAP3K7-binding protein 1-like [Xenia sp. Carnegie-2017]